MKATPLTPARLPRRRIRTVTLAGALLGLLAILVAACGTSPTEETPTPVESVAPEPSTPADGSLPEGAFALSAGPTAITVTIAAADWFGEARGDILIKNDNADPPAGAGMIVFQGDLFVYADPCQWSGTQPDLPATTPDELMAALSAQGLRDASEPVDITLDGHAGKSITLHVPDDAVYSGEEFTDCDEGYFGSWTVGPDLEPYRYHQGPGQIDEIWAVDVDGVLTVIDWTHYAGTPAEDLAETRAIVESATFE